MTPALLFSIDSNGGLDFVNERWAELTGLSSSALLGNGWTRCVHAHERPSVVTVWGEHILNREPFVMAFRLLRADNTYRWIEVQAVPELVSDGTVVRWFGAGIDIDPQRRALDALEFLAESGATASAAGDVETILSRMANASLAGIADVTIFDLHDDEHDEWFRFAVTSAEVPQVALHAIKSFQAPEHGKPHPIARAMDQGRSVHVPSVDATFIIEHVESPSRRDAWRTAGIRSLVAVPLSARGKMMGALTLLRTLSGVPFDAADVRVAEEIGRRAAIAVENVRLREKEARAAHEMEFFAHVGEVLSESLGLQETIDAVVRAVVPQYCDWAKITLSDEAAPLSEDARRIDVPLIGVPGGASLTLAMSESNRSFDRGARPFFAELARRIGPAIGNAKIFERERLVAHSFQRAALPASLPELDGFAFDAVYEAGRAEALVGGDWYDAFVLVDGRIVVSIGDVAGSGLLAAVTMASVRQAIRGVANVQADPNLMLQAADRALRGEYPDRFVTAFVGVIDPIAETIVYKSAGHLPALVRAPDGTCSELVSRGLPLGLRADDDPPARTAMLPVGSMLVLYTDGLIESTRDMLEGERRLRAALADPAIAGHEHPARALHDVMLRDGATDDVAILTVDVRPRAALHSWVVDPRDVARTDAMRRAVLAELELGNYPRRLQSGAELILAELVGNLKRYAPGTAEIVLEWSGRRPVLHVRDCGPGFEFAANLPPDLYSESGRGLFLISAFALDFQVTRRAEGGSHARIVLNA